MALLLRSAEIQPWFVRFVSDWNTPFQSPPTQCSRVAPSCSAWQASQVPPTSIWLVCNLPLPTGTAGADVPTPVQAAHRNRRGRRAHTRPSPPAFGLFATSRRPPEPQGPTCPHPSKPTSIWLVCNLPPPTGTAGADVPTPVQAHQHLACLQPPAAHRNRRGRRAHPCLQPPSPQHLACLQPDVPHPSKPTSIWLVCNLPPPTGTAGADVPTPVQAHPPGLTTPTGATGTDVHTTFPGPPPRLDPAHRSDRGRRARRAHYLSQPTPWLDRQLSPSYLPPLS